MAERLGYGVRDEDFDDDNLTAWDDNGWVDGQDPSVESLRSCLFATDSRSLYLLDRGVDSSPGDQEVFSRGVNHMCDSLRNSLDFVSDREDEGFDRHGSGNAAAWAAFHGIRRDMEAGTSFVSPEQLDGYDRAFLLAQVGDMQQAFARALNDPVLDHDAAVERMECAVRVGVSASAGDIAAVRDFSWPYD